MHCYFKWYDLFKKLKINKFFVSLGQKLFIILLKTVQSWFELQAHLILLNLHESSNKNSFNQIILPNKDEDTFLETKKIKKSLFCFFIIKYCIYKYLLNLRLILEFICSQCLISFTNLEKLNLHRNFYCKQPEKNDFSQNNLKNTSSTLKEKVSSQTLGIFIFLIFFYCKLSKITK